MRARKDTITALAYDILAAQFRRMLKHEPGVRKGDDPEELHDMRVAIRRLRAAIRAFEDFLPRRQIDSLNRQFQWIGGALGTVRDIDVYLCQLAHDIAGFHSRSIYLQPYLDRVFHERKKARRQMLRALDSARYRQLILRFRHFLEAHPQSPHAEATIAGSAPGLIRRKFRRVMQVAEAAVANPEDALLHRLRIQVKRLRYLCQFVEGTYGKPAAEFAARVAQLQDALGLHHDSVVAQQCLERLAGDEESRRRRFGHEMDELAAIQESRRLRRRDEFLRLWPEFARRKTWRDFEEALSIRLVKPQA